MKQASAPPAQPVRQNAAPSQPRQNAAPQQRGAPPKKPPPEPAKKPFNNPFAAALSGLKKG
jgi:hypothetical protein